MFDFFQLTWQPNCTGEKEAKQIELFNQPCLPQSRNIIFHLLLNKSTKVGFQYLKTKLHVVLLCDMFYLFFPLCYDSICAFVDFLKDR